MREEWQVDVLGEIRKHGRIAVGVAVGLFSLVAAVAVPYFLWFQPVRSVSSLEFTPLFAGAAQGRYPNKLPFGPTDVVDSTILSIVYDNNNLKDYCPREVFERAFFVDQQSDELAFLEAEFNARLSDLRLTTVDRERIQAEYQSRRAALPKNYQVTFVRPQACSKIPPVIVSKVMSDVLTTWASESAEKRGVMRQDIDVLSPSIFDVQSYGSSSLFIRAGVVRGALMRVSENVATVRALDGAALIRLAPDGTSFSEVQARLNDLFMFRLIPSLINAARISGRETQARDWILETVASADRDQVSAEAKVAALNAALREFAGTATPAGGDAGKRPASSGTDNSTSIDRGVLDLVLGMSKERTEYAQKLTDAVVKESMRAVAARDTAAAYRRLLPAAVASSGSTMAPAALESELSDITIQAKLLTQRFNDLYTEFSRVSFRSDTAMYRTEKPVSASIYRSMTARQLAMVLGLVMVGSFVVAFAFLVIRGRVAASQQA